MSPIKGGPGTWEMVQKKKKEKEKSKEMLEGSRLL